MSAHGEWKFGPYLADWINRSGLSQREIARRAGISEGRIRQLRDGYERRGEHLIRVTATTETVYKLSGVLGFPLGEALTLAGLPATADDQYAASLRDFTVQQVITDLGQRFQECQDQIAALTQLPPVVLNDEQKEARGTIIARLDGLATSARRGGDHVAADAMARLAQQLNEQIEAANQPKMANGAPGR